MIGFRTLLCAASAACGLTLGPSAFAAQVTIDVPGCASFSFIGNTLSCNTNSGTETVPACSISGSSHSATTGSTVNLTASCSPPATSYTWSGVNCTNGNSSQTCGVKSITSGETLTAKVTGTNSVGTGSQSAGYSVAFSDSPPPTGGSGDVNIPASCGDGSKTVQGATISNFDGNPVSVSIGKGQTAVIPIRVPAGSGSAIIQYFRMGGTSDQVSAVGWVSKTACDLTKDLTFGEHASNQWVFGEAATNLNGMLDGRSSIETSSTGYTLHMKQGEVWYVMLQNKTRTGRDSCDGSSCSVSLKANYQH